jgi:hypothetical protein
MRDAPCNGAKAFDTASKGATTKSILEAMVAVLLLLLVVDGLIVV